MLNMALYTDFNGIINYCFTIIRLSFQTVISFLPSALKSSKPENTYEKGSLQEQATQW